MPATIAAPRISDYLTHSLQRSVSYAERILKDIPADKFAHMPHPQMNHPAFCVGHLSLYPNRMFNMLGRKNLMIERPGYPELFQAGAPCVEQDGRYPAKDELLAYFFERNRALNELLPTLSDGDFARENPIEGRFRENFPTIGLAMNFLVGSHNMVHLGQISAWRRAIGMGPAM